MFDGTVVSVASKFYGVELLVPYPLGFEFQLALLLDWLISKAGEQVCPAIQPIAWGGEKTNVYIKKNQLALALKVIT